MWGSYNYQSPGLNAPNSPVLSQGSQGVGSSSQSTNSQDSFSPSNSSAKKNKKPWNWPLISAGLGFIGVIGAIIISKGRKAPKTIPPPRTGKVEGRKKVSTEEYKGFSS